MHLSKLDNLTILKPLTFENKKQMLCATDNYAFALMMFAKVDKINHPNGNFHCSLKDDGILYVDEKWQGAFESIFQNQKAVLYYIDDKGAIFNPAVPQFEFYENKKVVKKVVINNIYAELLEQIKNKKLKINYYKL